MKRLFIFICFLLFVSFIAANTQIQRPQKRNKQDRSRSSSRMPQFHSRVTPSISQPSPSEWARVYYEEAEWLQVYSVLENNTNDGYFITGYSSSWILKLSSEEGDVEWKQVDTYPDGTVFRACSIQQTIDGGYVAIGSYRPEYSSTGPGFGVIKFSQQFDVEWARNYDGPWYENPWSIQQTSDGGYVLAGATFSFIDPLPPEIAYDVWVLKLSSTGDVEWQKVYGGLGHEIQT